MSDLNDDCSQFSFGVHNVCVAQKLRISEFLIGLFSPGPFSLRSPGISLTKNPWSFKVKVMEFQMANPI